MALNRTQKAQIVDEVQRVASNAVAVVAADYRGLTVRQMTEMRRKAREADLYFRIVPNTLAKRAIRETSFNCLGDSLVGPIVLAFSSSDPGAPARLFKPFVKEFEKLAVKALVVSGQLLAADKLDAVASLPTKLEAISLLMSVMKAPISKFVATLAAPHTKLVRTVMAVSDQKGSAA